MDPVIHCGIAIVAARAALPEKRRAPLRDALVILTATLAGLAPDVDQLVHAFPPETGGLDYMLYHRGNTHTVLACLVLGLLLAAVVWLPTCLLDSRRPLFGDLAVTGVLGTELHLLFDGFVDYGVHPFWPWKGWVYGDFLFLSEPLLWLTLLPAVSAWLVDLKPPPKTWQRLALTALLPVLAIAWTWHQALEPLWVLPGAAVVTTVWGAAFVYHYRRDRTPHVALLAIAMICMVFFGASRWAKSLALEHLAQAGANDDVRHVITTATAGNPFCWRIVTSGLADGGRTVRVRMGSLSLLPALSDARDCVISNRSAPPSAGIAWDKAPTDRAFNWLGVFEAPTGSFFELAKKNCRVKATRHFLRAPFWNPHHQGRMILGDLRLDYFDDPHRYAKYTFDADEQHACESLRVPSWTPPLFDSNP